MAGADFDVSQKAQKAQKSQKTLKCLASLSLGKLSQKALKMQILLSTFNSKLSITNNL